MMNPSQTTNESDKISSPHPLKSEGSRSSLGDASDKGK